MQRVGWWLAAGGQFIRLEPGALANELEAPWQRAASTPAWRGGAAVGGSVALDLAGRWRAGHGHDELRHGRREPIPVADRRAGGATAASAAPRDHFAHRCRCIYRPCGGGSGGRSGRGSGGGGGSSSSSSRCRYSGLAQEEPQAPGARVRHLLAAPLLAGVVDFASASASATASATASASASASAAASAAAAAAARSGSSNSRRLGGLVVFWIVNLTRPWQTRE